MAFEQKVKDGDSNDAFRPTEATVYGGTRDGTSAANASSTMVVTDTRPIVAFQDTATCATAGVRVPFPSNAVTVGGIYVRARTSNPNPISIVLAGQTFVQGTQLWPGREALFFCQNSSEWGVVDQAGGGANIAEFRGG